MRELRGGLAYFALVFGAGFLLGCIRVPVLVPRLGVRTAELLEMPVMFVVIVAAARLVNRRFLGGRGFAKQLVAGLIALALLVTSELVLAVALGGESVAEYLANRDPVSGSVYLLLLVLFALMPAMLGGHRPGRRAR
jgi:hypothetical protein